LNIHLHCLVLDGVYLNRDGAPVFHEAAAPTVEELEVLLAKIITRTMRILTRLGALIDEPDRTYLAETATDGALTPLQATSCTYRIAPRPTRRPESAELAKPAGSSQAVRPRAACQRAWL